MTLSPGLVGKLSKEQFESTLHLLLDTWRVQSERHVSNLRQRSSVVTFPGHHLSSHIDTNPVRWRERLLCPLTRLENSVRANRKWAEPPKFQRCHFPLASFFFHLTGVTGQRTLFGEFFTEHHLDVRTGFGGESSNVTAVLFCGRETKFAETQRLVC